MSDAGAFIYMSARAIRIATADVLGAACDLRRRAGLGSLRAGCRPLFRGTRSSRPGARRVSCPVDCKALEPLRLEKGYRYPRRRHHALRQPLRGRARVLRAPRQGRFHRPGRAPTRPHQGRDATPRDGDDRTRGDNLRRGGRLARRPRARAAPERGLRLRVSRDVGLVYVPRRGSTRPLGAPLEVEVFGERVSTEVAPDVLYDPQGARIRA